MPDITTLLFFCFLRTAVPASIVELQNVEYLNLFNNHIEVRSLNLFKKVCSDMSMILNLVYMPGCDQRQVRETKKKTAPRHLPLVTS